MPGLYRWIRENYRAETITAALEGRVSALIFDLNSLIHDVAAIVFGYGEQYVDVPDFERRLAAAAFSNDLEREFFDQIFERVAQKSRLFRPDQLIVAIDGVPPVAKVQQQRLRRFKARPHVLFDSNAITPGTGLMARLSADLRRRLEESAGRLNAGSVLFSGPDEPGEGEHKFAALLREGRAGGPFTTIIHGMDADLILLSLLSPQGHIVIFHDDNTPLRREEAQGRATISREDERAVPFGRGSEFLHIDALRKVVQLRMATPTATPDFVLLCFLLGNDFAPRPLAAGSEAEARRHPQPGKPPTVRVSHVPEILRLALEIYRRLGLSITTRPAAGAAENPEIRWENFAVIIAQLAEREPELAEAVLTRREAPTWLTRASSGPGNRFDYGLFRSCWYNMALGVSPALGVSGRLGQAEALLGVDFLAGTAPSADDVARMCRDYLRAFAWSFFYYTRGAGETPEGALSLTDFYPNLHAPLYSDMAVVAASTPPGRTDHLASLSPEAAPGGAEPPERRWLTPPELLVAVLPPLRGEKGDPRENPLVPQQLRWLMIPESREGAASAAQLLEALPLQAQEKAQAVLAVAEQAAGEPLSGERFYSLFSTRESPGKVLVTLGQLSALREALKRPAPRFSPIADLFPIAFEVETYLGEAANEVPRIPLADPARIRAACVEAGLPPLAKEAVSLHVRPAAKGFFPAGSTRQTRTERLHLELRALGGASRTIKKRR